jgi:protein O-mannosyl-transferase
VPFFALSLVAGLVTIWFQQHRVLEGYVVRTEGFFPRLAAAGWAPWFYLYKALLPVGLTPVYPKWEINGSDWTSYVPGLILVDVFLIFWWKRETWGRPLLFGLGYFVVTLFPVLGFFDQAFYRLSLVADHWQYYSITGVIALAVAAGEKVCRQMGKQRRYWGTITGAIVVLVLGGATWRRSLAYQTDETLWRDAVAKNSRAFMAHYNLATTLLHAGRFNEAVGHYEQALKIKPDFVEARYNLGDAMLQQGRVQEAIAHYERALQLKPDYAEAHNNLGGVLLRSGKMAEAIAQFEQALRIKPDSAEAHSNLGLALVSLGKVQEGIGHFEQALRIDSDNVEAHSNLGMTLVRVGRVREAIGHLEQALRIKPDYAEVHNNLGFILWQSGRTQEAIAHWEQALQIKPDLASSHRRLGDALLQAGKFHDAIGHYDQVLRVEPDSAEVQDRLAWLLATLAPTEGGDPIRAVALAGRACALTGHQVPAYLDTLGAAYAAAGQFDEAIASAQKAVELARSEQPELVAEIEARLQLYRGGNAYRQRIHVTIPHRP